MKAGIVCPNCGSQDCFRAVKLHGNDRGCLILLLGGIIPALIYNSGRKNKVMCEECGCVFSPKSEISLKRILAWTFVGILALIAFWMLMVSMAENL